ncbi:MAG: calcium-binding protein [Microcoleaceae cyanobacterium]
MVTFLNDGGAAFINIGGINPPSITEATSGINARPIIANEPIAAAGTFFDAEDIVVVPLTAPGGGVSLAPILPITGNPSAVGISDFEPFERDLSTGELTSIGEINYRTFPLFQYGGNTSEIEFNTAETASVDSTLSSIAGANDDLIIGELGDDTLNGNQGNDTLLGRYGNDTLFGGQGNDTLNGNQGNDVLSGDYGQDILTGGLDRDTFLLSTITAVNLSSQADIITDFIVGEDRIQLTEGLDITNINLISTSIFDTFGTLVIENQSNLILGFISNIPPEALWDSFLVSL